MDDRRLQKIESEVRAFVQPAYPDMTVKAEYWSGDPSRVALFFIEEKFRDLYPQQRYHYIAHQIPQAYYDSNLQNTVWFELAPGERAEDIGIPDEDSLAEIRADVLAVVQKSGFYQLLDELFYSAKKSNTILCGGDFKQSKEILRKRGFTESELDDVFNVLMNEGAFCDCEILYNVAPESRLRSEYWQARHREKH